eukprot:3535608-Prymnesium_polylepis.1
MASTGVTVYPTRRVSSSFVIRGITGIYSSDGDSGYSQLGPRRRRRKIDVVLWLGAWPSPVRGRAAARGR